MIYRKVYDPPSWLEVMEGDRGCQKQPCHMAQFFYFEWWGYRFSVDKIGHTGQSCLSVCDTNEILYCGRSSFVKALYL